MLLGAWLHDLNPWILRFSESVGVRWYGVSYIAGFLVAWLILRALARRGLVLIKPDEAFDVVVTAAFGVLIGGRLGYIVFYQPDLLWTFEPAFPFWGVVMLNRGGMASHGGVIGVIVAAWLISRGKQRDGTRRSIPMLHVADIFAIITTPGLFFGRIANFINAELLGKIVAGPGQPAPWWSVRYPQEILERPRDELPQTPEQIIEIQSLAFEHALPSQADAFDFEAAYAHLIERVQRGDAEIAAQLEPLISARHPSQIYQAIAEGLIVGLVLWWVWRRPRLPGVVGAWFMISYGVLRIATEFVRLPNAEIPRVAGLSRGQWLSVGMIVVGAVVLTLITRRGGEKLGGWAKRQAA